VVRNQTGCRDNKCQGFGQEEPVWLTRACALLPPNDAGLRTQRCSWRRYGCLRRRRPRRFVAGGGVQDLNCKPKGGGKALPDLSRRVLAQARSRVGASQRVRKDHRRRTDWSLTKR
jgi:hypothetical protein